MLRELGVRGKKRILKWAQRNAQGSEETGKRTFAIKEMYPQVFYAFSDVIVFVLTQPKYVGNSSYRKPRHTVAHTRTGRWKLSSRSF